MKSKPKIILFLTVVIFGLSIYANSSFFVKGPKDLKLFPPFIEGVDINATAHLGAEYCFIARSIASGKGFSSPFQVDSGPTAWMLPLYPLLLSFLIKVFENNLSIGIIILFFKNWVLIFTGVLIYKLAKKTLTHIKPFYALIIYILWLVSFFRFSFQLTHDMWIILLFMDLLFLMSIEIYDKKAAGMKNFVIWGTLGGISALSSPAAAITWIFISLIFLLKNNKKFLLASFVIFCLINSLWVIRNYAVFGRFIPSKSNLYFDAYTVNYEKDNGLLDEVFFSKHPVWTLKDNPESEYIKLGEAEFSDLYREKFLNSLLKDPYTFLRKIKNRLLAAILFYYSINPYYETFFLPVKKIIYALPFCGLCLVIFLKKKRGHYFDMAAVIYFAFLAPYILFTYYIRYSFPLALMQNLFIVWGLDAVYGTLKRKLSV